MNPTLQNLLELAQLRHTAELYAQGADRKDKAIWSQLLAEDCVIEGPGFTLEGRSGCLAAIDGLAHMFRATVHRVHNQVATIDGDLASGETYCTADHLLLQADRVLVWTLRYLDHWQRDAGQWRFTRRKIILEWQETRPVTLTDAPANSSAKKESKP